ncbi:MAG: hypothetical protein M3O50_00330 [Myxococcota bacterium]|nr:hypothetical protein [Myxococcota bacterium]
MPGFHFEAGARWLLTIETIDVLRVALGDELLNAFARCSATTDRLLTLLDCLSLNATHVGNDTVRGERNLSILGMFSAGLIYELREGLQELRDLNLPSRLSPQGCERWAKIVEFAELKHEDTLCQIRNVMAFHIGEKEVASRGIRRLAAEKRKIVVAMGEGPKMINGRNVLGGEVLIAGISIRPPGTPAGTSHSRRPLSSDDFEAAIVEASESHHAVVTMFEEVFADLLRQSGAHFDPLPPLADNQAPTA